MGLLLGKPFCEKCIDWDYYPQGECRCFTEDEIIEIKTIKKGASKMKWILLILMVGFGLGGYHIWTMHQMGVVDDPLSIGILLGFIYLGLPLAGLIILLYGARAIIRFLFK